MSNRLSLFSLLFLISFNVESLCSQNTILYFQYDHDCYNISALYNHINRIKTDTEGEFVFYYNGNRYSDNTFNDLVNDGSFLQHPNTFNPYMDFDAFSDLLCKSLIEQTNDKLKIVGANDSRWKIIIMVSDKFYIQDLMRMLSVNNFEKRGVNCTFVIYDENAETITSSYAEKKNNINNYLFDF